MANLPGANKWSNKVLPETSFVRRGNSLRRYRLHFVGLYTQAKPHDLGADLSQPARRFKAQIELVFDSVQIVNPQELIQSDDSWRSRFHDYSEVIRNDPRFSPDLKWSPSWARTGLFSWKPRLILDSLLRPEVQPGDVVFYHDLDCDKYPEYLQGVKRWPRWLRRQMQSTDVLTFRDNRARFVSDVKSEVWQSFFSPNEAGKLKHVWAGAFAVKKTQAGIAFVEMWDSMAQDEELLLPFTVDVSQPFFSQHVPDQSLLACLSKSPRHWPRGLSLKEINLKNSRVIPPRRSPGLFGFKPI